MKKFIFYLIGIILFLFIWTVLSIFLSNMVIPYPWEIFKNLFLTFLDLKIYKNLLFTLLRSFTGFTLALIIGSFIGIITGTILNGERILFLFTVILQGAPPILWVIPLVLIFGVNNISPILVIFFVVLPLVIINIQEGIKSIKPEYWELFKIYSDSKIMKIKYLLLPSLSNYYKSIFILGAVLSLKSSLIGEWFTAQNGIGWMINEYYHTFNMLSFYSTAIIFLFIVSLTAYLSKKISSNIFKKRKSKLASNKSIQLKKTGNKNKPMNFRNMENTQIILKDISFKYGNEVILDNINFALNNNRPVVLTGKSGSGKTTFAKIITGLLKPESGKIIKPKKSCIIFQNDFFLEHLDVFKNAALPGIWKKIKNLEGSTINSLEKCELKQFHNYFPGELSGGMKKRLSFARALVYKPDFIILDEPFIGLHKEAREKLWNLFFKQFVEKGIPSIIITHYPEEIKHRNPVFYKLEDHKLSIDKSLNI